MHDKDLKELKERALIVSRNMQKVLASMKFPPPAPKPECNDMEMWERYPSFPYDPNDPLEDVLHTP